MKISAFINNAVLLLTLSMLSGYLRCLWLKKHKVKDTVIGFLYGFFAILAMTVPVTLTEGAIFDGRSIVIGLAGLFEPAIVVIIAAVLGSAYRIYLGGIGAWIGVGSIIISGALGLLFGLLIRRRKIDLTILNLLFFGFLVHSALVLWFFTFPKAITTEILNTIAIPYIGTFSLATTLIGLFMDGQQQRFRAEQDLAENEKKYRELVEMLQEGIWMTDKDAVTTFVNPSLAEMLGYSVEEMLGRPLFDFTDSKGKKQAEGFFERRKLGIKERHDSVYLHKNGKRVYTIVEATPVYDEAGNYAGSLAGIQDITDRVKVNQQLEKYSEELESMVEERTKALKDAQGQLIVAEKLSTLGEMAASVGHELRNPLSVIRNAAYLLKSYSGGDKKLDEYIKMIDTESRNASQIITDLLDYSRIHPMKSDLIEIPHLIKQVLEKEKPPDILIIEDRVKDGLPKALGNTQQISQIISNLIRNAADAMSDGGNLTISALMKGNRIGLSVKDTGIGIPKKNIHKLFKPLFTTKERGVGLGLTISKRLAELNEAEITVDSKEGKGSMFTLWLKTA